MTPSTLSGRGCQLLKIRGDLVAWAVWTSAALASAEAQPAPLPLVPEDETLAVTQEAATQLLAEVKPQAAIYALAWHPNGKELATGDASGAVTLWDLETGLEKRRLEDTLSAVHSLSYSPGGRWLAAGSDASAVGLWDLDAGVQTRLFEGWSVAFSPHGERLAIGTKDGVVAILDPQVRHTEPLKWQAHDEGIAALAWHPDGTVLATGSWDRTVKLWNSSDGRFLRRLKEDHGERVNAVSWSPGGDLLASAAADSTVRIWNPETGEELHRFGGHLNAATTVTWHPEGDTLASASHDATVRLWSYIAVGEVARFEDHGGKVFAIGFNPPGSLLASGTQEGFVGIWDFASGQLVRRLREQMSPVEALAFGQRSAPPPELEVAEPLPKGIQLEDGEVGSVTIKLRNPGPERAIWVNLRQASIELQDPIVFYAPPTQAVVEPGRTIGLQGRVSMHSAYESPESREAELRLLVTSTGCKPLFLDPIRVRNTVATVEWRGARVSFGGARLSVDLANTGVGPLSADHVALRMPDPIGPIATDVFRNLSVGHKARFVRGLPAQAELSPHLDFVVYKTRLPVHRWTFENQPVLRFPFDRPWLYLALLLMLLAAVAYLRPRTASWRPRMRAERSAEESFH